MWAVRSIVQGSVDNPVFWGYPHERHIHSHFYSTLVNFSRILTQQQQRRGDKKYEVA